MSIIRRLAALPYAGLAAFYGNEETLVAAERQKRFEAEMKSLAVHEKLDYKKTAMWKLYQSSDRQSEDGQLLDRIIHTDDGKIRRVTMRFALLRMEREGLK